MATFSRGCDTESEQRGFAIPMGDRDAAVTIGSLQAPHVLSSTGNLGSTKSDGDGDGDGLSSARNLVHSESKGDAPEIADNSRQQEEEKHKEEDEEDEGMKDVNSDKDEQDLKLNLNLTEEEEQKNEEHEKEELKKKKEEEKDKESVVLFLTTLLVLAMPFVAWRFISEPELLLWRQSLLLSSCCILWSHLLDDASTSIRTTLPIFSSFFLLALNAYSARDPKIGALLAHLTSYLATGMLGYALAERRQRDGVEVAAAAAAARYPSDEKEALELQCYQAIGCLYITLITLAYAAPVAWLLWHRADFPMEEIFCYVFYPLSGILMLWIMFVAGMLLRGSLIQEAGLCLLFLYLAFSGLLYAMVSILVGETACMMFISLGALGFPGILGYCISVHASFKLRLKQLQVKTDESKVELPLKSLLDKSDESVKQTSLQSAPSSASVASTDS